MISKIFLIHGRAQSGKNYCADILKKKYEEQGCKVLIIAFADYVKFFLEKYYDVHEFKTEKGRSIIQYFATDLVRSKDYDFWADVVARICKATETHWDVVIIPDWRFINEFTTMKYYFEENTNIIKTVCISRPQINEIDNMTEEQRNHASETELVNFKNFDYDIINDENIEQTLDKIVKSNSIVDWNFEKLLKEKENKND